MRLTKGHGTENDFLLTREDAPADAVRKLCDRHAGIGADGLIVAAPAAHAGYDSRAEWFMDYRNADGSLSEMCGNGIRVFVAYLRAEGLIALSEGESVVIATRGGDRDVRYDGGGLYTVDMGPAMFPGGADAVDRGWDVAVTLPEHAPRPGLRVSMPNPHTVVTLESLESLRDVRFDGVGYDPVPESGTNLEVVVPRGASEGIGAVEMRVLERGVGETRSCGTGCCSAAVAMNLWAGEDSPSIWDVHVPGGTVRVTIAEETVYLTGPAVLVAEVTSRIL